MAVNQSRSWSAIPRLLDEKEPHGECRTWTTGFSDKTPRSMTRRSYNISQLNHFFNPRSYHLGILEDLSYPRRAGIPWRCRSWLVKLLCWQAHQDKLSLPALLYFNRCTTIKILEGFGSSRQFDPTSLSSMQSLCASGHRGSSE